MTLPDPSLPWPLPMSAVALIAEREGCRLRAYRCPAGVWSVGWGETAGVTPTTVMTQPEADKRLCTELTTLALRVATVCTEHATPNQLGGLVSLAYNIGFDAFSGSTVLKAHNRQDWQAAARAFSLWDKARVDGVLQPLAGLTARRAAEAALYLTPEPDAPQERMPQAVAPETPIKASPIAQGGAAVTVSGIVAALAEAKDALGPLGDGIKAAKTFAADILGVPPAWIMPAIAIGCGIAILRWRLAQRGGGWC